MRKIVYIIGAGMGAIDLLCAKARDIIEKSDTVYTSDRFAELYKYIKPDIVIMPFSDTAECVNNSDSEIISVLVSGDTGFFSAARLLINDIRSEVELIPGISSIQYFCAMLQIPYDGMKTVSLHGRDKSILGAVSYNEYIFVLTGGKYRAHDICRELAASGLGGVKVSVGENLSMPSERISQGSAETLSGEDFRDLAVMVIYNMGFTKPYGFCKDDDFIRGATPMTKEDVRWISAASLNVKPTDIIFDIGAGSGSVSIELAHLAYDGLIYAIERDPEAFSLIKQNRDKFKSFNVIPLHGDAPDSLLELPIPDKAFIGGSGGAMIDIFDILFAKNPDIRITVNAITLESLNAAIDAFKKYNIKPDIKCINAARAVYRAGYSMMTANNPVYIISRSGQ